MSRHGVGPKKAPGGQRIADIAGHRAAERHPEHVDGHAVHVVAWFGVIRENADFKISAYKFAKNRAVAASASSVMRTSSRRQSVSKIR